MANPLIEETEKNLIVPSADDLTMVVQMIERNRLGDTEPPRAIPDAYTGALDALLSPLDHLLARIEASMLGEYHE